MKLKTVLLTAFLTLTLIPILMISILLYNSGYELSKQSYTRNLAESINVQADYIAQTMQNNMLEDGRMGGQLGSLSGGDRQALSNELLEAIQSYLSATEDKISVCILTDGENRPIYTIGGNRDIQQVLNGLEVRGYPQEQTLEEFVLGDGSYSIGVMTPIYQPGGAYAGSLVSVYDKTYLFKIISSYYEVADTATYICRSGGELIDGRGQTQEEHSKLVARAFSAGGDLDGQGVSLSGQAGETHAYYRRIGNLPWYLAGFIDHAQISGFMNQFIWVYLIIALVIFLADIVLALYVSQRVVQPINHLIQVIECYPGSITDGSAEKNKHEGYAETRYLSTRFLRLMQDIMLAQHNYEGMLQLYQSGAIDDIHIDIDVKAQTIHCNSEIFERVIHEVSVRDGACIVERFTNCFCEGDQKRLMSALERMRDKHLSVNYEDLVYTPHMHQKWYCVVIAPVYELERMSRLFVQLRDVSNFKRQELESQAQAMREPLTGLYNRAGLVEGIQTAMRGEPGVTHCLLFIDMNYFKMVNDNFGHSAGDRLLCNVAKILTSNVREGDVVARIGGDEFVVFLQKVDETVAQRKKGELEKLLVFPFHAEQGDFDVSASIGVAVWDTTNDETLDTLLNRADEQMYHAKRAFKLHREKMY